MRVGVAGGAKRIQCACARGIYSSPKGYKGSRGEER